MRIFNKLAACSLLMVGMIACKNDEPSNGGDDGIMTGDPFYSTVTISNPAKRSGGNNEGEEIGKDYENKISSILVILATKETEGGVDKYKFLTSAHSETATSTTETATTMSVVFENKVPLFDYVKEYGKAGAKVYMFAICNPTQEISKKINGTKDAATGDIPGAMAKGTEFLDEIYDITGAGAASIWTNSNFLMTSVDMYERELPSEADLMKYNTPATPFPLTYNTAENKEESLKVLRVMSRFDFKDTSERGDQIFPVYNKVDMEKPEADRRVVAHVRLTRMALFNMRNEFYYFPRVKDANYEKTTYLPGRAGMEFGYDEVNKKFTPVFVVSPDAHNYSYVNLDYYSSDNLGSLDWTNVSDILGRDEDGDGVDGNWDHAGNPGFHIWTYATENTFAKDVIPDNRQATGIVFETEIIVPEFELDANGNTSAIPFANKETKDGRTEYKTMYLYDDILFSNVNRMYDYVQTHPTSNLAAAFSQVFTVNKDAATGNVTSIEPVRTAEGKIDIRKMHNVRISVFEPRDKETGGYYCYYFYYNQHVNDGNIAIQSDMEFATVRNNIYKISVNTFSRLGGITPPDPDDWDLYFKVNVEVYNWVVRFNTGIEF